MAGGEKLMVLGENMERKKNRRKEERKIEVKMV
jgi:hypothetical protein